jgi:hypothetical protein
VTEQAVFDLVPFARPGWIVTDFNSHSRFISQSLQLKLPKPVTVAVASAAVSSDKQSLRFLVSFLSHSTPPAPDRLDCKLCHVTTYTDRNPGLVDFNVLYTVRNCLTQFFVGKVMCVNLQRLAFGPVLAAYIRLFSECFFLFRVDRHRRTSTPPDVHPAGKREPGGRCAQIERCGQDDLSLLASSDCPAANIPTIEVLSRS